MNQTAPSFTLSDAAGNPWRLASHLHRERLLVVRLPAAADLDVWTRQQATRQRYDLRVVALVPPGDAALKRPPVAALSLLIDPGGRVAAIYGRAALIGKDGGIKAVYSALPRLEDVLALIDTMPMRQQERQTRGQ